MDGTHTSTCLLLLCATVPLAGIVCFLSRDLSTNEIILVIGSTLYTIYAVANYVCGYLARADGMIMAIVRILGWFK